MQYTKPMIDLVYEIRRRVDAKMKPSVKMANPDLLKELAEYQLQSKDTVSKTLIKELLAMAGPEWLALLDETSAQALPRQIVKVYRGQTILESASPKEPVAAKPVRMYRGQQVL